MEHTALGSSSLHEELLGAYVVSPECGQVAVTRVLQDNYGGPGGLWTSPHDLHPSEQRALNYMAQGLTKEEMAVRCGLTPESAKIAKARLYGKLGLVASTHMRAVRTAIEHELLTVEPLQQTPQGATRLDPYELLLADVMSRNIPSIEARRLAGSKIKKFNNISNAMNQLLDKLNVPVGDRHREDRAVREAREGAAIVQLYRLGFFKKGLTHPSALLTAHGH